MLQVVALFLLVMLALGVFGKLRNPRRRLPGPKDQTGLNRPRKCPRCGRFLIGGDDCDCGKG
jgi:hypothetical protein